MKKQFVASWVLFTSIATHALAGQEPTDVVQMVDSAFDYVEQYGKSGLKKMNKGMASQWVNGDIYPFIVDCDTGLVMVHQNTSVLGVDLVHKLKDKVTGKLFLVDMCNASGEKPSGSWVSYWWAKPNENTPSEKITYVLRSQKFPSVMIGSGIYSEGADLDALNSALVH